MDGILADLMDLIRQGLIVDVQNGVIQEGVPPGSMRLDHLRLAYPGLLVSNGARLSATIPSADLTELHQILL